MKEVVVLGGGFAGVAAVRALLQKKTDAFRITLVDKNTFHTFTPSLYEVATAEEAKKNVAIPFKELFPKGVAINRAEVRKIDPVQKDVILSSGEILNFDYLIIALGSDTNYYGIPGLSQYGLPLKSVKDAVEIKKKIHEVYSQKTKKGEPMQVLIGGGGFSGTEFAAELISYRHKLCTTEKGVHMCMQIGIIQGSNRLLNELDERVSQVAASRVKEGGVSLFFGGHITQVIFHKVKIDNGKEYPYDVLVWTGGIRSNEVVAGSGLPVNKRGQVQVNQDLRVEGYPQIFAVGDCAEFINPATKAPAVTVAQVAVDQGEIAGENVVRTIRGEYLQPYIFRHFGYVVPLHGKFAVADLGKIRLNGFAGWIVEQLVLLRYLLGIMPLSKAFKRFNEFEEDLL